jgi:hypothetical protein
VWRRFLEWSDQVPDSSVVSLLLSIGWVLAITTGWLLVLGVGAIIIKLIGEVI